MSSVFISKWIKRLPRLGVFCEKKTEKDSPPSWKSLKLDKFEKKEKKWIKRLPRSGDFVKRNGKIWIKRLSQSPTPSHVNFIGLSS
jgi:hypothetical protein